MKIFDAEVSKETLLNAFVFPEHNRRIQTDRGPMVELVSDPISGAVLYVAPSRVMHRQSPFDQYKEVDGIRWAWGDRDGLDVDHIHSGPFQGTFSDFFSLLRPSLRALTPRSMNTLVGFDWASRSASGRIYSAPFFEGPGSNQRVSWCKSVLSELSLMSNPMNPRLIRMYHGTSINLDLTSSGICPTSASNKKSLQVESGYVYLAATPARALKQGQMANGGQAKVYEVLVDIKDLLADKDQLSNLAATGAAVKNTLAHSLTYAGGARVKGVIAPWAVVELSPQEVEALDERHRRMANLVDPSKSHHYSDPVAKMALHFATDSDGPEQLCYLSQSDPLVEVLYRIRAFDSESLCRTLDRWAEVSPYCVTQEDRDRALAVAEQYVRASPGYLEPTFRDFRPAQTAIKKSSSMSL